MYSHLIAASSRPKLLVRLTETLLIAGSALLANRFFDAGRAASFSSTAVAFAMLFAWCLMSMRHFIIGEKRPLPPRGILLLAFGWVLCEFVAVSMVERLHHEFNPSFAWFACWSSLSAASVIACRAIVLMLSARRVRTRSVALVGRGEHCAALAHGVASMPRPLYRIDVQFDLTPVPGSTESNILPADDLAAFAERVRASRIDELWLALPLSDEATLQQLLDVFRNDLVNIRFVPDMTGLTRFHDDAAGFEQTLAINLVASPLSATALAAKATFDRIFAFCTLILISPALLMIAIAVKFSSPGPVLFRQWRHGANGKPFQIFKFRTMRVHERSDGVVEQATRADPRITRVGAFLRRTSLDELPQFFNVLVGDMSVVGPRPHAIEHDALFQKIVDGYIHRYRIKPGITGWAQVNGLRGETDSIEKMQRRIEADLYYLGNWSLALDMRIVLATMVRGFVNKNAY